MSSEIGKTKDVGYQFGIRKTFPIESHIAWDFLFSKTGMSIWLGKIDQELDRGDAYRTSNGISGTVRVLKPYSHIRLTWTKPGWSNSSLLQVRTIPNKNKTTISFHQEKLLDGKQRKEVKVYWNEVMQNLEKALQALPDDP